MHRTSRPELARLGEATAVDGRTSPGANASAGRGAAVAAVTPALPGIPSAAPARLRRGLALHIDPEFQHVPRVHRAVRAALCAWDVPELADDMALLADELTANAVRYAGSSGVVVRLRLEHGTALLEVDDDTDDAPAVRDAAEDEEHGRGLLLVEVLSAKWGCRQRDGRSGKTVWCTLAVPMEAA